MPPVDVPTYESAYSQLGSVYDPMTSSVNQQIAGLQPLQDAQQSGLDQAKVNAFRDITQGANAKGVMFSGVPIDQQATYVGTKYLPAVANLKQTFANQRTTLLDKINQINAQRATQAQGIVSDAQKNAIAAQNAAADQAYKQAQLGLGYARLNASGSRAPSAAELMQQVATHIVGQFNQNRGRDSKVSNETWANALNDWTSAGGTVRQFWQNYGSYTNGKYGSSYAGYNAR